ncbi:MAG TPA: type II secretion system F family protein [Xanthobacteraceae bacterium]|jgi:tight adherence protein B
MPSFALFVAVAVAIGGVAWVFLYPLLSGERKAELRQKAVTGSGAIPARVARGSQKARREQIEEALKELEHRHAKSVPLTVKIAQAGLSWSKQRFLITAGVLGGAAFLLAMAVDAGILAACGLAFAAAVGFPLWTLKFLKRRREFRFLMAFPDAVDIIVRGIKAGLPLIDSLRIITIEAPEPLKSEFRSIVETQAVGMPVGEACGKLYERIPVAEANFFGIVISIQQRSGGNLSEALGNLSRVLRDRKKMKAKIQAMSVEAKASAMIIGCLPVAVMLLVYVTSPQYIELLWTTPLGRVMLAGCAVWMSMGVLVMRKMINFDF